MSSIYGASVKKSVVNIMNSSSKLNNNYIIDYKVTPLKRNLYQVVRYNCGEVLMESDISQHLKNWNDSLSDGSSRYKHKKQIKEPSCETCVFFSPAIHRKYDIDNSSMFIGRCSEITSIFGMNSIRRNQGMRCHGSLYQSN
jgi:hypothetical protein